jgi:hypothetical protein
MRKRKGRFGQDVGCLQQNQVINEKFWLVTEFGERNVKRKAILVWFIQKQKAKI